MRAWLLLVLLVACSPREEDMSITPIKSTIQAPPASRDVSAILRSIRGSFVNMSSDPHSRLQVANPKNILSANIPQSLNVVNDLLVGYPKSVLVDAALDEEYGAYFGANLYAATDHYQFNTGKHAVRLLPGNSYLLTQTFAIRHTAVTTIDNQSLSVGFFNKFHGYNNPPTTVTPIDKIAHAGLAFESYRNKYNGGEVVRRTFNITFANFGTGYPPATMKIPQEDWNIDTLRDEADIAKNPSRVQIDFGGDDVSLSTVSEVIQLAIYLDYPHSGVFGFIYDGVFLPAHRFFIEDQATASNNKLYKPLFAPSWLTATSVDSDTPGFFVYNYSAQQLGEAEASVLQLGLSNTGVVSIPTGSVSHVFGIQNIKASYLQAKLRRISIASDTIASLRYYICRASTPTTAGGFASGSGGMGYVYQREARGAVVDYNRILKSGSFSLNTDVEGFDVTSHPGLTSVNLTTATSNYSDEIDIYVGNNSGAAVNVTAGISLDLEY